MRIIANMLGLIGIILLIVTVAIKVMGLAPINLFIVSMSASTGLIFANTILLIAVFIKISCK